MWGQECLQMDAVKSSPRILQYKKPDFIQAVDLVEISLRSLATRDAQGFYFWLIQP